MQLPPLPDELERRWPNATLYDERAEITLEALIYLDQVTDLSAHIREKGGGKSDGSERSSGAGASSTKSI